MFSHRGLGALRATSNIFFRFFQNDQKTMDKYKNAHSRDFDFPIDLLSMLKSLICSFNFWWWGGGGAQVFVVVCHFLENM